MQTTFISASRFADEFASAVDCYHQNLKRYVV